MIKKLILFLALVAFSQQSFSQVEFGPKATICYTNAVDNNPDFQTHHNYRLGFQAGIFSKLPLSEKFSVNPELLYSNKGFIFFSENVHLNYINLPLLLSFEPVKNLRFQAGPELGYLINARSKTPFGTTDIIDEVDNRFEYGAAIGVGYTIKQRVTIGLRYSHGMSSIVHTSTNDTEGNPVELDFYNRTFHLSVALNLL